MTSQPLCKNVQFIHQIHHEIHQSITHLDQLKLTFQDKQENKYLKVFMTLMDKMSDQIAKLKKDIMDRSIQMEREEKYQEIAKKANFYQEECFQLKKQLKKVKENLLLKTKQLQDMKQESQILHNSLFKKQKQAKKYRARSLKCDLLSRMNTENLEDCTRTRADTWTNPKRTDFEGAFKSELEYKMKQSMGLTTGSAIMGLKKNFNINKKLKMNKTFLHEFEP